MDGPAVLRGRLAAFLQTPANRLCSPDQAPNTPWCWQHCCACTSWLQSKLHSSFSSTTALVLLTRNENTWTSAVIQLDDRYRAHGWKMMYALLNMSLLKFLFQGAVVLCLWVEPLEPGFRLTGCCNRGGRAHLDTFILLYHIKDCIITIIAYHINSESST